MSIARASSRAARRLRRPSPSLPCLREVVEEMSLRRKDRSTFVGLSLRSAESRSEPSRDQGCACAQRSASSTVHPKTLCALEAGKPLLPPKIRLLDTSRREDPGAGAWSKKPDASASLESISTPSRTEDALTSSAPSRIPPRNAAVRSDAPFVEPSIRAPPRRVTRTVGPRCLPLVSPVPRSSYPQAVPSLWIIGLRPWDSRS